MAQVIWTDPARSDLQEIQRAIARNSREYARLTVMCIRQATAQLTRFPESGRVVPEFPDYPYREVLSGQYRIVYRFVPEEDRVTILAVTSARRRMTSPAERE